MSTSWREVPLGDLVENLDRQRVPVSASERAKRAGSVPYYGAAGQVGTIDVPLFNEELVLLGEDGVQFFDPHKSKAYCISGPSWVNNHAHVLRPHRDRVDHRFLLHFLNHFDYAGFANGTTRLKLTQAAMNRIPVILPPLDEQRRIVAILEDHLSRLDEGLRAVAKVKRLASQLIRHVLATQIDALEAERRPMGVLLREDMRNGHSARASMDGTGIRTLTLTAVTVGEFSESNSKMTVADPSKVRDLWLEPGDILVERSNTAELVGTAALYEGPRQWAIFPDLLIRLRANEALVVPKFLELTLKSPSSRRYLTQRAKGLAGSMPKIDQGTLASLQVPVPSLSVQRRIVEVVESLAATCERVAASATVSQSRCFALRRSLLAAAFSGQLTKESLDV